MSEENIGCEDVEFHNDDTVTIYGTRYSGCLFRELGCSFPNLIGKSLRIISKENGVVTVEDLHGGTP